MEMVSTENPSETVEGRGAEIRGLRLELGGGGCGGVGIEAGGGFKILEGGDGAGFIERG